MRPETRKAFTGYIENIAQLNGLTAEDVKTKFTVAPSVQQRLENKIQESAAFLQAINIVPVEQQSGEVLYLGVDGPIASRTNTNAADRAPRDPSTLEAHDYFCLQTNSDTSIKYAKLDMWAKFPDFQTRVRDAITTRQALDRMLIGFRGVSAAATSDPVAHPNLEDVNIGWLQHIRVDAPAQVMSAGGTAGKIKVGRAAGTDYRNLDAMVYDQIQLLAPVYREDPKLVCIVGRGLLHDKYFGIVNDPANDQAIDKIAVEGLLAEKKLGGLPVVIGPYMPDTSVLVTTLDNISIYYQAGSRRRTILDWPRRDQIENYESSNDAYVIEQYLKTALYENIEIDN